MLITAWILFCFFGVFALWTTFQYIKGKTLNWFHSLLWLFSVFVTALSAGAIWGGLFENVG